MSLLPIKQRMINALEEMDALPNEFYCLFHIPATGETHFASQVEYYKLKNSGECGRVLGLGFANRPILANVLHHVPWELFLAELQDKIENYNLDYSGISLSNWRTYRHHQQYMPEVQ